MTRRAQTQPCPTCGVDTLVFTVPLVSAPIRVEHHQVPITTDLAPLIGEAQVWRDLGPHLGWDPLHVAARDWRPLHARHTCDTDDRPDQVGGKQQHKHKEKLA